ncbi:hypothetical protein JTE90_013351 [Oedothorax gibbosus]|uniref:Uncharacterized protein n=1 Tax=Oedothorax gibbosus TaxID=931172 RepID=A0AAV6TUQ8_9ARAC|nr:hypothetical protein JTE90_013351 [Oedothorax gibbosus]
MDARRVILSPLISTTMPPSDSRSFKSSKNGLRTEENPNCRKSGEWHKASKCIFIKFHEHFDASSKKDKWIPEEFP